MTSVADRPAPPPVDPRFVRRWIDARRQEGRRRLRLVAGAAAVAVVAALGAGCLVSPLLSARHVRVSVLVAPGPAPPPAAPSAAAVARAAGVAGRPLVEIDAAAVARRLDSVPALGAASVRVRWPQTVSVAVTVRVAVAAVSAPAGGWALVDPTGRVLADTASLPAGMPVVTVAGAVPPPGGWLAGTPGPAAPPAAPAGGVDIDAAADAPDLPAPPAAALAVLGELPAVLRGDVVSTTAGPGLTLVIAPPRLAAGTVTVAFGDGSQLAAKVTALLTLLDAAPLAGIGGIDLTVPSRPALSAGPPPQA